MSYVNDATGMVGDEKAKAQNCAYCTVAAIFRKTASEVASALGVDHGLQPADGLASAYMAMTRKGKPTSPGAELQYGIELIKAFVSEIKAKMGTPVYVSQGGSWNTLVPLSVQTKFMSIHPTGTQFAVWACQAWKGAAAHWNYAVKEADGLHFYDYQYNDAEDHPPKRSRSFIAPDEEDDSDYVQAIVIVLRSKVNKLGSP